MQTKQGAVLESLRAVDQLLDENADRLGDVVDTGARRTLRDALVEIDTHATDQTASSLSAQGLRSGCDASRRSLKTAPPEIASTPEPTQHRATAIS